MYIGEDGHMRIFCCGRAVTGIGHVVVYKPPPKKEKPKKRNVDEEKNDPVAIWWTQRPLDNASAFDDPQW